MLTPSVNLCVPQTNSNSSHGLAAASGRPAARRRARSCAAARRTRRRRAARRRRRSARCCCSTSPSWRSSSSPATWPQRVVDRLEAVEIEEQHGVLRAGGLRHFERALQPQLEFAPVGQARQRVVARVVRELLRQFVRRRDVGERAFVEQHACRRRRARRGSSRARRSWSRPCASARARRCGPRRPRCIARTQLSRWSGSM